MHRIFISTGEVSGDLQGSLLVMALLRQAKRLGLDLDIVALGGDRMATAGATLLSNTSSIGSVGLWEALPYIIPTWQIQQQVRRYLVENPPDRIILIDYRGPNVSLGTFLRQRLPQIPIFYYIAPQEWVWSVGQKSIRQILDFTDRILAIFPGEARYYQEKGANVTWVGHPLLDAMQDWPDRTTARVALGIGVDDVAIALLPASRRQELRYLLPVMFEAAQQLQTQIPHVQFWIPLSLEIYRPELERAIDHYKLNATLLTGQAQSIIAAADLAITKSGTVNLEIALQNVPQVVVYRVSRITAWLAVNVLKFSIPFMSPVNLVLMQELVPELLQNKATSDQIFQNALELLQNTGHRQQVLAGYVNMREQLGTVGVCDRAALEILHDWVEQPGEKILVL